MHHAMTGARRKILLATVALVALGATGYALAASSASPPSRQPTVTCGGPTGAMWAIRGRLPADVATVYLGFASGASLQAEVVHDAYTILTPATVPARPPTLLDYVDAKGRRHQQQLAASLFPTCPGAGPVQHGGSKPRTPEQRAMDLDNAATERVGATVPGCGPQLMTPTPRLTLSDATPDPVLLRSLGVLRRAPTRAELAYRPPELDPQAVLTLYRRFVRIVHLPDGSTARISAGEGQMSLPRQELPPCQRRITATLKQMLHGQPRDVQRRAMRLRLSFKLGAQTRGRHPWLEYDSSGGGTGGPFDAKSFASRGLVISGGSATPPPGFRPKPGAPLPHLTPHYALSGLVPDGVATVTLRLTGHANRHLPFGVPPGGVHPWSSTTKVVENAFSFKPPEDPTASGRQTIIWRNAAGRIIRTFH